MKERFEELEKILEANCRTYENDCTTCPYAKECEVVLCQDLVQVKMRFSPS